MGDEFVEPARGDVGDQDESVAGVGLHEVVDLGGHRLGRSDEGAADLSGAQAGPAVWGKDLSVVRAPLAVSA